MSRPLPHARITSVNFAPHHAWVTCLLTHLPNGCTKVSCRAFKKGDSFPLSEVMLHVSGDVDAMPVVLSVAMRSQFDFHILFFCHDKLQCDVRIPSFRVGDPADQPDVPWTWQLPYNEMISGSFRFTGKKEQS